MYGFTTDVPITEELYAKIRANLGTKPLPGLLLHLVVRRGVREVHPSGGVRGVQGGTVPPGR